MLKIEKLIKLFEATRCKGNTTHLLESVQGTNVDLLVYDEGFRKLLYQDGFTNVATMNSCCTKRAFVLDNAVIYDAIDEALKYIEELEDKLKKRETHTITINSSISAEQIGEVLKKNPELIQNIIASHKNGGWR